MNLTEDVDELVTQLKAAGIDRVVTRIEDVAPPCVWVALESVDHYNFGGEALYRLFLVPGAIDEYRLLTAAGPLLDQVLATVSPSDLTTVVTLGPPYIQNQLPALRVTTTRTV